MRRFALVVFACINAFSFAPAGADIYQWKDENGKTIISDKPPVGYTRQQRKIESEQTSSNSSPSKSIADRDLDFRKRQKESQESAEKVKKEQTVASERRELCDSSRRYLQSLESGERLALRDEKGERYFMEDAQREQETGKARQAVQENCK